MDEFIKWMTTLYDPTTGLGGVAIAVTGGIILLFIGWILEKNKASSNINNYNTDHKIKGDHVCGDKVFGDKVNGPKNITYSGVDKVTELIRSNDLKEATELIKTQKNQLGATHPMYPDFYLDIEDKNGSIVLNSKPLRKEALHKHPQSIKGKFNLDAKYASLEFKSMNDILNYSFATQQDIDINMIEMKKMIGDKDDPFQGELEYMDFENSRFKINHCEFPAARPFKVVVEDSSVGYDYILLRVYKTEYQKPIVYLNNKEQNMDVTFDIELDLGNKVIKLNIKQNHEVEITTLKKLKLLNFFKSLELNKKLSMHSIDQDLTLFEGRLPNFNYDCSQFENINKEIQYYEMLQTVENKFNKKFIIPEIIDDETISNFSYIITALEQEGIVTSKWEFLKIQVFADDLKNIVQHIENEPSKQLKSLNYEKYSVNLKLFDENIVIPKIEYRFNNLTINHDELLRLNTILRSDPHNIEAFEIKFTPGDNAKCKEIVQFEETK